MLPCSVITVSSLLVFFLPPQSGEKISFGMSVLVAFTVFLILVGSELPESSEHTPHICKFVYLFSLRVFLCIYWMDRRVDGEVDEMGKTQESGRVYRYVGLF